MTRLRLVVAGLLILGCLAAASPHGAHPTTTRVVAAARTTTTTTTTPPAPPSTSPPATAVPVRQSAARASRARASRPPLARAGSLTPEIRARVIAAIYAYDDWDAARMVRVASCESGLSPWAVNGSHHGIFQIVGATLGLIEEHVALAHSMWQRRGMQPWQCKG